MSFLDDSLSRFLVRTRQICIDRIQCFPDLVPDFNRIIEDGFVVGDINNLPFFIKDITDVHICFDYLSHDLKVLRITDQDIFNLELVQDKINFLQIFLHIRSFGFLS